MRCYPIAAFCHPLYGRAQQTYRLAAIRNARRNSSLAASRPLRPQAFNSEASVALSVSHAASWRHAGNIACNRPRPLDTRQVRGFHVHEKVLYGERRSAQRHAVQMALKITRDHRGKLFVTLIEGTGLETLALLVPAPKNPGLGTITWGELFAQLGTGLPSDYMALMERYGAGIWSNWLRFVAISGLCDQAAWYNDGYRTLRAEYPEYHPLPMWPEAGGFLPFASSIDGDYLGWLTDGDPEQWKLIIVPRHNDQGPPLPGDLVSTLLCRLRGEQEVPNFPVLDELDDPLEFMDFSPIAAAV